MVTRVEGGEGKIIRCCVGTEFELALMSAKGVRNESAQGRRGGPAMDTQTSTNVSRLFLTHRNECVVMAGISGLTDTSKKYKRNCMQRRKIIF